MRVLIDVSSAGRGPGGGAVYVEGLVAALREAGRVEVVEARQRLRLRPGGAGTRRSLVRSAANAALDALWLHVGLPRAVRASGADVVHHPLPAYSRRIKAPQVSTVHDLAFLALPGSYDAVWRRLARRSYRRAARLCAQVVCPTRATATEVVSGLGADPDRLSVVHYGPGQVEPSEAPGSPPADGGYLLFVGDTEPRKNLTGLLEAYAAYRQEEADPAELVLAGRSADAATGPGVHGRAAPDREALVHLLRGARALVHPSLHEGFGFTPLEAMAMGVPVLAVANAGTVEVCGDAALLVAPEKLQAGLRRIATEEALRADLSRRGRERVTDFSWDAAARGHERVYTLALGRPPGGPTTP